MECSVITRADRAHTTPSGVLMSLFLYAVVVI
jgi:hypothetical protein